MAGGPHRTEPMVSGGSNLHPLGSIGHLGTPAQPGAGAWDSARHDAPRRHQCARTSEGRPGSSKRGSQAQRAKREVLGPPRGGYRTRACLIANGLGRAIAFRIVPGQAHELPEAIPLLESLPSVPSWVVADRGSSSHSFREHICGRHLHHALRRLPSSLPSMPAPIW